MKKKQNQQFKLLWFFEFFVAYFVICYCFKLFVLKLNSMQIIIDNPIFGFYIAKNTGAAFSILNNNNFLLSVFAAAVCVLMVFYVIKNIKTFSKLEIHAFVFFLSGVCSNMVERFCAGHVTDYIKLNFVNFPIFNLADAFINIGVFLFLIVLFTKKNFSELEGKNE